MIEVTREMIVAEAREWEGTPFVHQGRVKKIGTDCVGLIIGIAKNLSLSQFDIRNYSMRPDPVMMRRLLDTNMQRIGFHELLPADVIYFRVSVAQHLALVTEISPLMKIIHAYSRDVAMRCLEQPLGTFWTKRIEGCYRFRGLACS